MAKDQEKIKLNTIKSTKLPKMEMKTIDINDFNKNDRIIKNKKSFSTYDQNIAMSKF